MKLPRDQLWNLFCTRQGSNLQPCDPKSHTQVDKTLVKLSSDRENVAAKHERTRHTENTDQTITARSEPVRLLSEFSNSTQPSSALVA